MITAGLARTVTSRRGDVLAVRGVDPDELEGGGSGDAGDARLTGRFLRDERVDATAGATP